MRPACRAGIVAHLTCWGLGMRWIVVACVLSSSGCVAYTVASTAVSVTATAVETTVDIVGGAVDLAVGDDD